MRTDSIVVAISLAWGMASAFEQDLVRRQRCNADNCARAVTGTARGSATRSARLADCTSNIPSCTVTPTTVYPFTLTFTTNGEIPPAPTPVTECPVPSIVPSYASACRGPLAYSSACSCGGVSVATTTLPTPVEENQPFFTYRRVTCTTPSPPMQTGQGQCNCEYQLGCGFYECETRQFGGFIDSDACRDNCDGDPLCSGYVYDPGRGQCQFCTDKGTVIPDSGARFYGYRVSCPADSGCNPYNDGEDARI